MQINTQNLFFSQTSVQKANRMFLTGTMRTAISKNASQKQELYRKAAALSQEKRKTSIAGSSADPMPVFSMNSGSVTAAGEIERYYQAFGNAVDNLTCLEEQFKYMQAEYDKASAEGNTEKAGVLNNWIENQCKDMSWTVRTTSMGITHSRIDNAERLFGKAFSKEDSMLFSGLYEEAMAISQRLKGAGSVEDALKQIGEAKEQMKLLADDAAKRYETSAGKQLSSHVYKTAEDYTGIKWDSHFIYHSELQLPRPEDVSMNLAGIYGVHFSQMQSAGNFLDQQA